MLTADFDYPLPPELIAQTPPPVRGTSRMLVLDRARPGLEHRAIGDIGDYLRPGDLLVLNDTRVFPARVLGAKNRDIFIRVITPATLPFILTAVRLGASVALTTIIAAESAGSQFGLGMRIRALSANFDNAPMLAYVIVIGIIGILLEKGIRLLEKKLTGWQETIK